MYDGLRDVHRRSTETDSEVRSGLISGVMWASMGDWPMFKMTESGGTVSTCTSHGDSRRYVPGLRVKLVVDSDGRISRAEVETSDLRVSGVACGPGGAGFRHIGGPGTVVHWAVFGSDDDRSAAVARLEQTVRSSSVWDCPGTPPDSFLLRVVGGGTSAVRSVVRDVGGRYEGSELMTDSGGPVIRPPDFVD